MRCQRITGLPLRKTAFIGTTETTLTFPELPSWDAHQHKRTRREKGGDSREKGDSSCCLEMEATFAHLSWEINFAPPWKHSGRS